jgi:hypothetical protein
VPGTLFEIVLPRIALTLQKDAVDGLVHILDSLPPTNRKRHPAARTSSYLAFLDEVTESVLDNYTPEQLVTVLNQRTEVCHT